MPRLITFFDGQQSPTAPDLGSIDLVVTGSEGTPEVITAAGGISIQDKPQEMIFVKGNGGATNITAIPQIEAGSTVGQRLYLIGSHATETVILEDGNGLKLNGNIALNDEKNITLIWTGSVWKQISKF